MGFVEVPPKCPCCGAWLIEDETGEWYCKYCGYGVGEDSEEENEDEEILDDPELASMYEEIGDTNF